MDFACTLHQGTPGRLVCTSKGNLKSTDRNKLPKAALHFYGSKWKKKKEMADLRNDYDWEISEVTGAASREAQKEKLFLVIIFRRPIVQRSPRVVCLEEKKKQKIGLSCSIFLDQLYSTGRWSWRSTWKNDSLTDAASSRFTCVINLTGIEDHFLQMKYQHIKRDFFLFY